MCIFKTNNKVVCRSIAINEAASFNIVKENGILTAYAHIGDKITSMIVVSEDSAKIWVQKEIFRELKTWITL